MAGASGETVTQPALSGAFIRDRLTWLSYFMLGFYSYLQSTMGPLMPTLRSEFNISYTVASLHLSMLAAGSVTVGIFGERIAKRVGRRFAFWGGSAGIGVGAIVLIISPFVAGTIASTFLMGFCGGFLLVTVQANLAELHGARRGIAIAESNVAASSFSVIAALTIGAFERFDVNWRAAIVVALVYFSLLLLRFNRVTIPNAAPVAVGHHATKR